MRDVHKGWPAFEELALRFASHSEYKFYQLGAPPGPPLPGCIRQVNVQVSAEHPNDMIDAITEHHIDVVVSWSPWPETFCFAIHEALAAGAFLLTYPGAGNVALAIAKNAPEQGLVLNDEASLFDLFATRRLHDVLAAARCRRGVLIPEGGSAATLRRIHREFRRSPLVAPRREIALADV